MRKALWTLTALLLLGCTACGQSKTASTSETVMTAAETAPAVSETTEMQTETETNAAAPSETAAEQTDAETEAVSSGILVAYFTPAENGENDAISSATLTSWNGEDMGAAEVLANMIANSTGGDLFSIQTVTDYPLEYDDLTDYAKGEQDRGELPELTTHIENLDSYDTVFIVYPAWWYTMPQAVYSFFDEYDFSGKTIIPAATHLGSRLAGSPQTIRTLEPGAAVIDDGFSVTAEDAANAQADVQSWLAGLGF